MFGVGFFKHAWYTLFRGNLRLACIFGNLRRQLEKGIGIQIDCSSISKDGIAKGERGHTKFSYVTLLKKVQSLADSVSCFWLVVQVYFSFCYELFNLLVLFGWN